jgi:hypothetical protein
MPRAGHLRQVPLEAASSASVDHLGRGREDFRAPTRLSPPRPVMRRSSRRFPEWELGHPGLRRGFADKQPYDVLDATKLIPEETCRCGSSAGWCWTAIRTTSSPRPNRSPSCRRTSCRGSTSPTTRCCRAGCSPISTPRSRGWARPISTRSRSTRRNARCKISSATG